MAVLQWISHLSLDFVCLQETHVTSLSESSSWFSSNGFSSVVSPGSVHSCGTVILFRPAYYFRDFQTDDSGPFVLAEFQIRESLFRIACVYAPNRNLDRAEFFCYVSSAIDPSVSVKKTSFLPCAIIQNSIKLRM